MRVARLLMIAVVTASLVAAFLADGNERPSADVALPHRSSVPLGGDRATWFCPGGSSPGGVAEVGIELINAGTEPATAVVNGVRSGSGVAPRTTEVLVDAGERRAVRLVDLVADSAWMGAVVEVDSADVVVEQTFIGRITNENPTTGSDRAPCHTRTATSWIVASGATRVTEFGEEMALLVLNPFLDDAVLDIAFDSDVGVDSLTGVVIPAQRVVAVDITEAVTVASRVSAVIDVVAGSVAVSRLQLVDNDMRRGLAVTPATADAASIWYLPTVHRSVRDDVVTVVNPSTTETADVDLEIIAEGISFDPIELTIRPGRSVAVPLADEERLEGATSFSIVARSLGRGSEPGIPIGVMQESSLPSDGGPVSNLSSTAGLDAASTRWVAPMEVDDGRLVLINPSSTTIATAQVSVWSEDGPVLVAEVELDPGRRAEVESSELEGDRPIVLIESTSPVVVGRELAGVSLHQLLTAIALDLPVTTVD